MGGIFANFFKNSNHWFFVENILQIHFFPNLANQLMHISNLYCIKTSSYLILRFIRWWWYPSLLMMHVYFSFWSRMRGWGTDNWWEDRRRWETFGDSPMRGRRGGTPVYGLSQLLYCYFSIHYFKGLINDIAYILCFFLWSKREGGWIEKKDIHRKGKKGGRRE